MNRRIEYESMHARVINRRGQIAIWVIVALVIAVSIGILLLAGGKKKIEVFIQETYHADVFIERCARDATREALATMLPQGGFLEPKSYKQYRGKNVTYLCETVGYFEPCISQHPMLLEEIRAELSRALSSRLDECFLDLRETLEERGSEVTLGPLSLALALGPGQVKLDIRRPMNVDERGTTRTFENFDVTIAHPVYDLSQVAIEIASQEAKYCYFEYVGYMILYPRFDIKKTALSDSTKIYTITDIPSQETIQVAIRSCAIPPGV